MTHSRSSTNKNNQHDFSLSPLQLPHKTALAREPQWLYKALCRPLCEYVCCHRDKHIQSLTKDPAVKGASHRPVKGRAAARSDVNWPWLFLSRSKLNSMPVMKRSPPTRCWLSHGEGFMFIFNKGCWVGNLLFGSIQQSTGGDVLDNLCYWQQGVKAPYPTLTGSDPPPPQSSVAQHNLKFFSPSAPLQERAKLCLCVCGKSLRGFNSAPPPPPNQLLNWNIIGD